MLSVTMLAGCGEKPEPRGSIDDAENETPTEAEATPTPTAAPTMPPDDKGDHDPYGSGALPTQPDLKGAADSYEKTRPLKFRYGYDDNGYYYAEKNANIVTAHCTTLYLDEEHYPELTAAVKEYNEHYHQYVNGKGFQQTVNEAVEANKDPEQTWIARFSHNIEHYVTRSDSVVTSIVTWDEGYYGGAHGTFYFYPKILDSANGEALTIYDVLEDGQTDTLPELLDERLKNKYKPEYFYDDDLAGRIRKKLETNGDLPFTLSYDSITYYFQIYELGPFASGYQTVTLPFNVYPKLVKKKYTDCADEYIVQIPSFGMQIPGTEDMIYAGFNLNNYKDAKIYINYNDESPYEETVGAYGAEFFLAHLNNIDVVLADVRALETYEEISSYRIENGQIIKYKTNDFFGLWGHMPGDVQNVRLYARRHYLSTYFVYTASYMLPDGSIVSDDDFYYIEDDGRDPLVLKHDLTAHDLEGNDVRLFEGAELYFFRTDADSWIDLKTTKSEVVRLYVNDNDWPQTIEGEDVSDIFENLYFAEE